MLVINDENICCFDVDETLISVTDGDHQISIPCPYSNMKLTRTVNFKHRLLLEQMYGRGRYIIVWSAAGVKWAEAVVRALHLDKKVHMVITKPIGYVDDKDATEWLGARIYLGGINE